MKIKGWTIISTLPKDFRFECQRCGQCCTSYAGVPSTLDLRGYGFQFVKRYDNPNITAIFFSEVETISKAVGLSPHEFCEPEIMFIDKETNLVEYQEWKIRLVDGNCIFFDKESKSCKIYDVRPLTCRCFPFRFNIRLSDFEKKELVMDVLGLDFCKGIGKGKPINVRTIANILFQWLTVNKRTENWFKAKQFDTLDWVKYPYPRVGEIPKEPLYDISELETFARK